MIFKIINANKLQIKYYCTKKVSKNVYSSTILLPKTKFPQKLEGKKLIERDENYVKDKEFNSLYEWQKENLQEPEFILHDGPPYANGAPHMGHAINKILKDTILRCKVISGQKVHFVPGWDCHGLPIELKALTKGDNLSPLQIRQKARNFASETIEKQKEIFKSWGLMGDWDNCYTTFSKDYVRNQFQQFYSLYDKKLVYRAVKPIYWSPSSRTALAEAELEYNEQHQSTSVYLRLRLKELPHIPTLKEKRVYGIIWTTTPWSLPANQAVCFNENLHYNLIKRSDPEDKDIYIVATDLFEDVVKNVNDNFDLLGVMDGSLLKDATYQHPIYPDKICKFFHADHVLASKGTGLVHTAPAHGPDDFVVALNKKLEIVDLVNDHGCYNEQAGDKLKDQFVLTDGTASVLNIVKDDVMSCGPFVHSYPYDWRTKKPVIIKASKQWFIDTEALKNRAIELLNTVEIIPKVSGEHYKLNLINQLKKRPYWCISRQRKWGVPIPVFYNKQSNETLLDQNLINHYCKLLDSHGTDFWWNLSDKDLFSSRNMNLSNVEKGQDILDIWFDSGISWSKVLNDKVADMYLEGVDQFTGWFQASLMTSVALKDRAPYKSIYVHGFAVDENGVKMSKSIGNVVDPVKITKGDKKQKPFGIDALRWWVACHANQDSKASVGANILQSSTDELSKIRNALRFALGSLNDYKLNEKDSDDLLTIDKYMLHLLYEFNKNASKLMQDYQFQKINILVLNFLTNSVSALYYTAIKDRLYCDSMNSASRRSAQYVLYQIFETVTRCIAPIVPHLAEEMYQHLGDKRSSSFFKRTHLTPNKEWRNLNIENVMENLLDVKKEINRQFGANTNNLIAEVYLPQHLFNKIKNFTTISNLQDQLIDVFQVAKVLLREYDSNTFKINLTKTVDFACPRCRKIVAEKPEELCSRCSSIVLNDGNVKSEFVN